MIIIPVLGFIPAAICPTMRRILMYLTGDNKTMVRQAEPTQAAKDLGMRLRSERKRQRITQRAVAKAVGCAQQTVLDIENGHVEWSRFLPEIASHIGVSLAYLETGEGPTDRPETAGTPVPVVTWDYFDERVKQTLPLEATDWLDGCPVRHSGELVAVIADEASAFAMKGTVRQNDWLFVDLGRADVGLLVCMMAGWHRAELRELTSMGGKHYLQSSNPALPQQLLPVSAFTNRDEYMAALQVPGQDTLPCLVLGRVIFQGVPR
jgi:transcriptional regulator with XRE-family HTH domain